MDGFSHQPHKAILDLKKVSHAYNANDCISDSHFESQYIYIVYLILHNCFCCRLLSILLTTFSIVALTTWTRLRLTVQHLAGEYIPG